MSSDDIGNDDKSNNEMCIEVPEGMKQYDTSNLDTTRKTPRDALARGSNIILDRESGKISGVPEGLENGAMKEVCIQLASWGIDDILLISGEPIRYKRHGRWYTATENQFAFNPICTWLDKTYLPTTSSRVRSGTPVSFAFSYPQELPNGGVVHRRFRAEATAVQGRKGSRDGIAVSMRSMPEVPPTMDELNLPQALRDILFPASGIVLVTGETGSGKTTLLGSVIRAEATSSIPKHIVTAEDPIEFDLLAIPGRTGPLSQSSVGEGEMIKDYATAIKTAMRRNPDIMMQGESRDRESIDASCLAAKTGHRVYTTVHTNNVAITIPRMIDVFPAQEREAKQDSVIDSTRAIIHQRLLPTRDGKRIAIRSWLETDSQIRSDLFGLQAGEYIRRMQKFVESHGRPLNEDLELYKDLIEEEAYDRTLRELQSLSERIKKGDIQ